MAADDARALALATWVGERAPLVFAVALAGVLVVVALAWAGAQRWAARHERRLAPPSALPWLWFVLGFCLLVGAGALFAELAEGLDADESMGRIDDAFTRAVQRGTALPALHAFAAVTRLGDTATLTVIGLAVALALLWRRHLALALAWATAVVGNAVLNVALKAVFERARPLHEDGLVFADGYSFPSGHSSGAVAAYGMLAYLGLRLLPPRWHLPVLLLAATAAFATGCSRAILRVHHASDVLAGFATGSAWLAVCVIGIEAARHYRGRRAGAGASPVPGAGNGPPAASGR